MEVTVAVIAGLLAGIYFNFIIVISEVRKMRKILEERE